MPQLLTSRKGYGLLLALIIVWGCNWPVMKIALSYISPLWFCTIRFFVGSLSLFGFLLVTQKFRWPQRADIPMIIVISIFQIGLYLALITLGLQYVSVGQSGILSYSTPVWVAPIAIFFFKEPAQPLKIIGLLLSFVAIVVLFNPVHHDWSNKHVLIGNIELLLAAISCAVSLLYTRFAKWHSKPLILIPWQFMAGAFVCLIGALCCEPFPEIKWDLPFVSILFYTSIVAGGFAYWCVLEVAKTLPTITTSLGLLGSPLLGLILATVFLHEPFSFSLGISLVLFLLGMVMVNISDIRFYRRIK